MHPEIRKLLKIYEDNLNNHFDILAVEGAVIIEGGTVNTYDEVWVTLLKKEAAAERIRQRNPHLTEE